MYLLDTNVVSEYRKKKAGKANPGVVKFIDENKPEDLYLCVQVVGEIQAGIQKLIDSGETEKATVYQEWVDNDLLVNFPGRILPFTLDGARMWGTLNSNAKKDPHTADRQIAAIALMCKEPMTVVTRDRNSPGFLAAINYGLMLFNPFT